MWTTRAGFEANLFHWFIFIFFLFSRSLSPSFLLTPVCQKQQQPLLFYNLKTGYQFFPLFLSTIFIASSAHMHLQGEINGGHKLGRCCCWVNVLRCLQNIIILLSEIYDVCLYRVFLLSMNFIHIF